MKRTIYNFYPVIPFINILFCLITFSVLTSESSAQTVLPSSIGSDINVIPDHVNHSINIEFKSDQLIYNLLILVTDSTGQTVFLDNKQRFNGKYKQGVDLQTAGKGKYLVKIVKDNERFERNLILK